MRIRELSLSFSTYRCLRHTLLAEMFFQFFGLPTCTTTRASNLACGILPRPHGPGERLAAGAFAEGFDSSLECRVPGLNKLQGLGCSVPGLRLTGLLENVENQEDGRLYCRSFYTNDSRFRMGNGREYWLAVLCRVCRPTFTQFTKPALHPKTM